MRMALRGMLLLTLALWLGLAARWPTAQAQAVSHNPILTPMAPVEYVDTPDEMFNLLILGIDYGGTVHHSSAKEHALDAGHGDAIMVVTVNLTKNTMTLISIPRDTLTYLPGVRGMYKINGAINCADTVEEGIELTCQAVSWLLGGVRIDKYVAVDTTAVVALGDAIGGITFDVDVGFKVNSTYYRRGVRHLDGEGIYHYMRARQNAAEGKTDLARVDRQRRMMKALFEKVAGEPALITDLLGVVASGQYNIFMNVGIADLLALAPTVLAMDMDSVASYSLGGVTGTFKKNFTYTDPENRLSVIREVFGVQAKPLDYVSQDYTQWLSGFGLEAVKFINNARAVLDYARAQGCMNDEQTKALSELEPVYDAAVTAFDAAADSMAREDNETLRAALYALERKARRADGAFEYPENLTWERPNYWYIDDKVNEKIINWN